MLRQLFAVIICVTLGRHEVLRWSCISIQVLVINQFSITKCKQTHTLHTADQHSRYTLLTSRFIISCVNITGFFRCKSEQLLIKQASCRWFDALVFMWSYCNFSEHEPNSLCLHILQFDSVCAHVSFTQSWLNPCFTIPLNHLPLDKMVTISIVSNAYSWMKNVLWLKFRWSLFSSV